MSRLQECLQNIHTDGKKALITYVMAGYPNMQSTKGIIDSMILGGADIIEIGFPFSDPMADGHAIQKAASESIKNGTNLESYFELVQAVRKTHPSTPLLMMTYANVLHSRRYSRICLEAAKSGLDGFIIPDMALEESLEYCKTAKKFKLDTVFLASPNTSNSRLSKIAMVSSGFLYLVAVYGTTGSRAKTGAYTLNAIRRVKNSKLNIPIGAGFGIRTADDAKMYANAGADAVIIGSAYMKIIESNSGAVRRDRIRAFTAKIKAKLVL